MIGRFAVDPRALAGSSETGPSLRSHYSRLARIILEFGTLHLMGEKDKCELEKALREQAAALGYDFWTKLHKALASQGPGVLWAEPPRQSSTRDYCESGELDELGKCVDLLVVDNRSRIPGLDSYLAEALYEIDQFAQYNDALEVTLPNAIDDCETITSLRSLREEHIIEAGTARDEIWADYFSPLASISTKVTIFDKFFFSGVLPWRKSEYLLWILNCLDDDLPPGATVDIYAYPGDKLNERYKFGVEEIGKTLRNLKRWKRQLNLFLTDQLDHDRHMRFSCGHAVKSDGGFDHLRFHPDGRLRDPFSYSYLKPGRSLDQRTEVEERAKGSAQLWVLESKLARFEEVPIH